MERLLISKKSEEMEFEYPIVWTDTFCLLPDVIKEQSLHPGKICIVTDSNVSELYLEAVKSSLHALDTSVFSYVLPSGEENKNLEEIIRLYEFLIRNQFDRKDMLLALGGGVTGDMTGFTAATFLRGISYIQVPTTLLSQVDSSVGGKTGVDFRQYKNMIGAFYQPKLVFMNMAVLKTLPESQLISGLGEVVKTALIQDAAFYLWLKENRAAIQRRELDALTKLVQNCCRIKANVVRQDPKDTGVRAILNFGHTIGHAIEKLSHFSLPHGHCVGIGMEAAVFLSMKKGLLSREDALDISDTLSAFHIPVVVDAAALHISAEDIRFAMLRDKKVERGTLKFILLHAIGQAIIVTDLTEEDLLLSISHILDFRKELS